MLKKLVLAATLALAVLSSGCAYKYSYRTGLPPAGEKITRWQHIFAWGHSETDPVHLDKLCPRPIAEFGCYESFPNWLCTVLTVGFYSPQTIYVVPAATSSMERGENK
jgi:hypothetical protein